MAKINLFEYIENNTIRCEASHRGGGIEISAEDYLHLPHARMSAYQNYLGGGMTGSVQSSRNFDVSAGPELLARADKLAEALKEYYYNITNDIVNDWDDWASSESFEAQQSRPSSAY